MERKTSVPCPNCTQLLRVPNDRGLLLVTCPNCRSQFKWSPDTPTVPDAEVFEIADQSKQEKKSLRAGHFRIACIISALLCLIGLILYSQKAKRISSPSTTLSERGQTTDRSPHWVNISYDELIDRNTITHSGRTVGMLLDEAVAPNSTLSEGVLSDLQPYLEPFSFICNEVITGNKPSSALPYLSILSSYSISSRQPAWAALFREGSYQLYSSEGRARIFLKGKSSEQLFDQYYGVIRHPLRTVIESSGADRITLEVYAFNNDYAARTIRLDMNPYVLDVTRDNLNSKTKDLPLPGLREFFSHSPVLEAAEIDEDQNFYLYGTSDGKATVGGQPESLEDFAVVYRGVFHSGYNAPYISLDQHEDNRYAKVNFGGLLEDTRVGSVVLEADKLFKTLSTGLDPNTRLLVRDEIRRVVPDFLTEDERSLMDPPQKGIMHIRYWFYPDKIRTVTDDRIGAVANYQFLADAERMDERAPLGRAEIETITHLNTHFEGYTRVFPTFQELQNVGRMMAIVNWLLQTEAQKKVDLDALLSVELSPFTTPKRTIKMLAVTASTSVGRGAAAEKVRRIFCLDKLVESSSPSTDDESYLRMARQNLNQMGQTHQISAGLRHTKADLDSQEIVLGQMQSRIKSMQSALDRDERTLDRYDENEVDRFNARVRELNSLVDVYKEAIVSYNQSIGNLPRVQTQIIASIGGGINLRPADFAKAVNAPDSPLIQKIYTARRAFERGALDQANGIIRSATNNANPGLVTSRPLSLWRPEPSSQTAKGDLTTRRWLIGDDGQALIESNSQSGNARYQTTRGRYFCETLVKQTEKGFRVRASAYPNEIIAVGNALAGETIVLKRGKSIDRSTKIRLEPRAN